MPDTIKPELLLISADLMLGGTAHRHATDAGFTVVRCLSETKAIERLAESEYPVVLVELGIDKLDIPSLKTAANTSVVIGFAGHVRGDLLGIAEGAGIQVLTNGQLHGQGTEILRSVLAQIA